MEVVLENNSSQQRRKRRSKSQYNGVEEHVQGEVLLV